MENGMANYVKNVKCIYYNCDRTPWSNPELSFFSFPHKSRPTSEEKERFTQWVKRCGSEEAKCLEVDESADCTKRICSLHFYEDDMYSIGRCRSLLRHALPHDCRGVYGDVNLLQGSGEKPSVAAKSQDSIQFVDISLPYTTVKKNLADNTVLVDSAGPEVEFSETSRTATTLEQPSCMVTYKSYKGRRSRSSATIEVSDEGGEVPLSEKVEVQPHVKPKDIISGFCGFSSLKTENDLLQFCGISAKAFQLLLALIPAIYMNTNLSREDHLLIFLLQMKTGISSAVIKTLFSIPLSEDATRGIFSSLTVLLKEPTQKFIMWPDKPAVIDTMPDFFQKNFSSCRVLLYCLYVPFKSSTSTLDPNDVLTVRSKKFLIGFTPSGAINFVSKAFPGNFSLLKVIIYSKVLNLLEPEDSAFLVLDENHQYESDWNLLTRRLCVKRISILFPPRDENELTIIKPISEKILIWAHAIKQIKRVKSHKILFSFGGERINCVVDNIVFMACVLANLQPLQ
ncbi:hypothetical protein B566_EDAN010385 [Ephemera danica]|nr:hypothetical protein B566_EDAN010385 [Ephemera danica]